MQFKRNRPWCAVQVCAGLAVPSMSHLHCSASTSAWGDGTGAQSCLSLLWFCIHFTLLKARKGVENKKWGVFKHTEVTINVAFGLFCSHSARAPAVSFFSYKRFVVWIKFDSNEHEHLGRVPRNSISTEMKTCSWNMLPLLHLPVS